MLKLNHNLQSTDARNYGRQCTLHVGNFLIFVRFIKIRVKKVKNSTIVHCFTIMYVQNFEKIIYNSLYVYCVSHELLISENSGFKTNTSTVDKLLAITHNIYLKEQYYMAKLHPVNLYQLGFLRVQFFPLCYS